MDTVSDHGSGAIASRASVGARTPVAGLVQLPHGSPASPVGSAGCSTASHTPIPLRLPSGRGGSVRPDGVAVPRPAAPPKLGAEYPPGMNESSSKPLGRTIVAGLILLIAAWVLLHFVIGIVTAIASVLVVVLAIVAVVWALRVLL